MNPLLIYSSVQTTLSTCPVTNTVTIGKSTSLEYTHTLSTVYETITSTVCTHCVPPPAVTPGPGAPQPPVAVVTQKSVSHLSLPESPENTPGANPPANNGPGNSGSYSLITKTIVPVASQPAGPNSPPPVNTEVVSSSKIPGPPGANTPNGPPGANVPSVSYSTASTTVVVGPTGSSVSASAHPVTESTGKGVPPPSYEEFTGGAAKAGASLISVVLAFAAVVFML